MTPEALHKAAVLISSLDTQAADALLEQMGPAVAERVRAAMMELPEVSEEEQQRVIQEFLGRGKPASAAREEVELELSSAAEAKAESLPAVPQSFAMSRTGKRFDYLAQIDAAVIARTLHKEAPQTAAVVLAHLDAHRAADVLKHLPTHIAGDILFRIANLDEMSDEVLFDLEQQMHAILSPQLRTQHERERGVARLDAILQALPSGSRGSMVAAVANRDQRLAGRLQAEASAERQVAAKLPPPKQQPVSNLRFEDLAELDDLGWGRVLKTADPETVLLAFAGAEPKLIDRLVRGLSRQEAAQWRKRFAHPGPVRLRDIDAAQQTLADTAAELADEGKIRSPRRRTFAAVA